MYLCPDRIQCDVNFGIQVATQVVQDHICDSATTLVKAINNPIAWFQFAPFACIIQSSLRAPVHENVRLDAFLVPRSNDQTQQFEILNKVSFIE